MRNSNWKSNNLQQSKVLIAESESIGEGRAAPSETEADASERFEIPLSNTGVSKIKLKQVSFGIDKLEVRCRGHFKGDYQEIHKAMIASQVLANSGSEPAVFRIGGRGFQVLKFSDNSCKTMGKDFGKVGKKIGRDYYRIKLVRLGIDFLLCTEEDHEGIPARVTIHSLVLMQVGIAACYREVRECLDILGVHVESYEWVRCDVRCDLPVSMDGFYSAVHEKRHVNRGGKWGQVGPDPKCPETITYGTRGNCYLRIYDKNAEIHHKSMKGPAGSEKALAVETAVYKGMGVEKGEAPVARIEFEFRRDFFMEKFSHSIGDPVDIETAFDSGFKDDIGTVDSLLVNLPAMWKYLTESWIRFTELPNSNTNGLLEIGTDSLWKQVQNAPQDCGYSERTMVRRMKEKEKEDWGSEQRAQGYHMARALNSLAKVASLASESAACYSEEDSIRYLIDFAIRYHGKDGVFLAKVDTARKDRVKKGLGSRVSGSGVPF